MLLAIAVAAADRVMRYRQEPTRVAFIAEWTDYFGSNAYVIHVFEFIGAAGVAK